MGLEMKILRVQREGRASVLEIAEKTMVAPARLQRALDRLEELGILRGSWCEGRKVYLQVTG